MNFEEFDSIFPPPPPQMAHSSTELINGLLQIQTRQKDQIRILREQQVALFQAPTREMFEALCSEERQLLQQIEVELRDLDLLQEQLILTPGELHRVDYLHIELQLQRHQVLLFITEVEQLASHRATTPYVPMPPPPSCV